MQQDNGRSALYALRVAAILGLCACGGSITFSDTNAIAIGGPKPSLATLRPQRVELKADRIEINEKIQFDLDKATIKTESNDLLDEISKVFADNPQIKKVEIVGHTSDEGADKYNKTLSEKRAQAVLEYLAAHGVDKQRMVAKGMGETKPIADNSTADGKEKNRRVEFLISEQDLTSVKEGAK